MKPGDVLKKQVDSPADILGIMESRERTAAKEVPLVLLPGDTDEGGEAMVLKEHVRWIWLGGENLKPGMVILQPGSSAPVGLLTDVSWRPVALPATIIRNDPRRPKGEWRLEFEYEKYKFGGQLPDDQEIRVLKEKITA